MHPILYSEIKQSLREYKSLLFFAFVIVVSRAKLGDYGHLINILLLFPILASALGVGTLAQEYSKDNLKYLLSMPIKRWHFIVVKIFSCVITLGFFLLIIYISKWLIQPRIRLPIMASFAFSSYLNVKFLLTTCIMISLFQFAIGIFFIIFFKSSKIANAMNYLPVVSALIYLLYCFCDTGYKFKLADYTLIFIPTSLMLTAGAFYLFTINNPFLNKNPKFLITGITVCIISIGYFAGSTQLICTQRTDDDFVFNKGVEHYSVSPDGEFVAVETCTDGFIRHSYVLDSSGALLVDFGKNSSIENYVLLWGFNNGKRMINYAIEKPILSEISRDRYMQSFILDLDSRNLYKFKSSDMYDYKILNNNTMDLIGIGYVDESTAKGGLCLFKQNILTGSVEEIQIENTEGVYSSAVKFIDTEHFIVEKDKEISKADNSIEKTQVQLNILDIQGQKISEVLLPKGVGRWDYSVSNGKYYFFEKLTNETGYSYRVASGTAEEIDEIYLSPEELPRYSFREAAEGKHFGVTISSSPNKKWLMCKYNDTQGMNQLLLLDSEGKRINAKIKEGGIEFTPTEERFMIYLTSTGENNSKNESIQIYDISGQQVVFVKEFETEDDSSNYNFLDNDTMIYVKDPTPDNMWGSDSYLVRLDLKTMKSTSFFKKPDMTADK